LVGWVKILLHTQIVTIVDEDSLNIAYNPQNRHQHTETERVHSFTYQELTTRDKCNLDITWLRDESLQDTDNLPPPETIAAEIVENLESALEQFKAAPEEPAKKR
jgi:type I restriction enzyme M protein